MNEEKLRLLARDLGQEAPRSPREVLGGYVILGRCVDKCRSTLLGINGEYEYWPCSLCRFWGEFTGIDHEDLKTQVATGATDDEIGSWVKERSQVRDAVEIIRWNNRMRDMRLSDLPDEIQEYLEEYIPENLPGRRPVYVWFDVFDIEEGRL